MAVLEHVEAQGDWEVGSVTVSYRSLASGLTSSRYRGNGSSWIHESWPLVSRYILWMIDQELADWRRIDTPNAGTILIHIKWGKGESCRVSCI